MINDQQHRFCRLQLYWNRVGIIELDLHGYPPLLRGASPAQSFDPTFLDDLLQRRIIFVEIRLTECIARKWLARRLFANDGL